MSDGYLSAQFVESLLTIGKESHEACASIEIKYIREILIVSTIKKTAYFEAG